MNAGQPFVYRAFGLTIHSELELPELSSGSGSPDLEICFGNVPKALSNPIAKGARFQATAAQFLLWVDGHARYLAIGGRRVLIEPNPNGLVEVIRLFLLSSVIAGVLHQRGVLPLRATAIELHGAAALFMGASGAGKSTLAATLCRRGYRVISDDVTAIGVYEGRPYALPGVKLLNLWADATEALGYDRSLLQPVRPCFEKYQVSRGDAHHCQPVLVSDIFAMSRTDSAQPRLTPLKGIEKMTAIVAETCWPRFLVDSGWVPRHFEQCSAIAAHARAYKLERPERQFSAFALADSVEAVL